MFYLVRHGAAQSAISDSRRPLSAAGRDEINRLAHFLARAEVPLERILHSGVERAAETAALLGRVLLPSGPIEQHDGLLPNDPVAPIARRLALMVAPTMVVGHQPFMGALTTALLCPGRAYDIMDFPTGGTVCVTPTGLDQTWRLDWALQPHLLPPPRGPTSDSWGKETRQ